MTDRIRDYLRSNPLGRPAPRRRPRRRRATTTDAFAQRAAGHPRLLRREGQPGAGDPRSRWPSSARASTAPRSVEIEQVLATGATRRPHLLRQHHQEGARHRPRLSSSAFACSPSTARRRSRRSPAPHPASKVFCRILCDGAGAEWPLSRKFGCAPGDGGRRARACASRSASSPMASRSMSARSSATPKPGTARWRRPRSMFRTLAERGIQLAMVNLGGGFPTRYLKDDARRARPMARRSSGRCASISATASRRRSSSRAAAWSATPA